ncbi:MAG TPA: hypothetical protein P5307_05350 [Pirellulaceae bacterium]|nr:hypothetical protein [Planctomycetales bacterium]MCB9936913.1 hypothetical protein [Planctomycetaceae bacterium]HRX78466.1 hypothetical protein [Pirellulaceae bacterium]
MFNLCIAELSEIIEGSVSLGAMPPLAGLFEPIGRVVVDVREIQTRDVLWTFESRSKHAYYQTEDAYARGAMGVVVVGRRIEPWAGKFCVNVADSVHALHRLMRCLRLGNGDWPATVFGQDESMQEMMQAVWQRDQEAVRAIAERLDQRAISAA